MGRQQSAKNMICVTSAELMELLKNTKLQEFVKLVASGSSLNFAGAEGTCAFGQSILKLRKRTFGWKTFQAASWRSLALESNWGAYTASRVFVVDFHEEIDVAKLGDTGCRAPLLASP